MDINANMKRQPLGQWLEQRCREAHLSLRQAAARTGLSHGTIRDIMNGTRPLPETIEKLARGFGGNGAAGRLALQDRLLVLAGYRSPRAEGEEPSELLAQLMDKAGQLKDPQIKMMGRFADFLIEIEDET